MTKMAERSRSTIPNKTTLRGSRRVSSQSYLVFSCIPSNARHECTDSAGRWQLLMALCPIEMKRCGRGRGGAVEAIRFHCRPRAQRRKKLTPRRSAARLRVSQNKPGCAALRDAESDSGVHGNEIVDFSLIGLVVRECIQISLGDLG